MFINGRTPVISKAVGLSCLFSWNLYVLLCWGTDAVMWSCFGLSLLPASALPVMRSRLWELRRPVWGVLFVGWKDESRFQVSKLERSYAPFYPLEVYLFFFFPPSPLLSPSSRSKFPGETACRNLGLASGCPAQMMGALLSWPLFSLFLPSHPTSLHGTVIWNFMNDVEALSCMTTWCRCQWLTVQVVTGMEHRRELRHVHVWSKVLGWCMKQSPWLISLPNYQPLKLDHLTVSCAMSSLTRTSNSFIPWRVLLGREDTLVS